ncbi:MAG: ABC transporter substrate-binding protein [Clostridiales bacterium]|jgi:branched-chain amino acid transport system substrate-binding protein|nr:ABC transporter substrate-binding protein [Clostridiales bacterium]
MKKICYFFTLILFFNLCGCVNQKTDEIKIGVLAPLTGNLAQYGQAVLNGVKLYVDAYNENGGLGGKPIACIEYDEEGDCSKAIVGFNFLVDKGIAGLVGDAPSVQTLAIVDDASKQNFPVITPTATAVGVTYDEEKKEVRKNLFRACFLDSHQGEKMAIFAKKELKANKAAVLCCTENDHSMEAKDFFVKKAKELGIKIVAIESFLSDSKDFKGQLTNILSKKPDCLFIPYYYETIPLIASQAKSIGLSCTMLGTDGWDSLTSIILDPTLFEDSYFCSAYSTSDPNEMAQTFLNDYRKKFGRDPNTFDAEGYDAAKILISAIEKVCFKKISLGTPEFKQGVIDAMKETDLECVTGHISFDEFNNPIKNVVVNKIVGGKAIFCEKY